MKNVYDHRYTTLRAVTHVQEIQDLFRKEIQDVFGNLQLLVTNWKHWLEALALRTMYASMSYGVGCSMQGLGAAHLLLEQVLAAR